MINRVPFGKGGKKDVPERKDNKFFENGPQSGVNLVFTSKQKSRRMLSFSKQADSKVLSCLAVYMTKLLITLT